MLGHDALGGWTETSFDRDEQIMFIRLPGAKLETEVQVQRIFDAIRRFWVRECAGAKVYCVVDGRNGGSDGLRGEAELREGHVLVTTLAVEAIAQGFVRNGELSLVRRRDHPSMEGRLGRLLKQAEYRFAIPGKAARYTDFSLNIALTAAWAAGVQHDRLRKPARLTAST